MRRLLVVLLAAAALSAACEDIQRPTEVGPADRTAPLATAGGSGETADVVVVLDRTRAPGAHAANRAEAAEVARELGARPARTFGTALYGFAASVPEGRITALERDPRVRYVDRDIRVELPRPRASAPPCGSPPCGGGGGGGGDDGSTSQTLPWGIDRVDADLNSNAGSGIHLYVIDTGIDSDHPDLQANLGNGFAAVSCRGGSCNTAWDDDNGHGSHVSGTAGAIDNDRDVVGVAPSVTLHAVKVLDKRGSGSLSDVIAGVDWVASEVSSRGAAAVANMSLGASGSKSGSCDSSGFTGTDSFHESVCNAANVGVVTAVAAGNDGADAEGAVPAAYDDAVISVSATAEGDDWPGWSNWGDDTAGWTTNASAPVAIAAPGVDVLSTWNDGGTNTISGTSMASPHTAGACALFLASIAQSPDYSAFTNTRSGLLGADESTDGFSNTSGNPHDEDFLDAESL